MRICKAAALLMLILAISLLAACSESPMAKMSPMAPAALSTLWRPGFWGTHVSTVLPVGNTREKSLPMPCGE